MVNCKVSETVLTTTIIFICSLLTLMRAEVATSSIANTVFADAALAAPNPIYALHQMFENPKDLRSLSVS